MLPCAAHPRVATKEARAASRARSRGSNWKGRTNTFVTDALGLERVGDELPEMHVALAQAPAYSGWCQARPPCSATLLVAKVVVVGR